VSLLLISKRLTLMVGLLIPAMVFVGTIFGRYTPWNNTTYFRTNIPSDTCVNCLAAVKSCGPKPRPSPKKLSVTYELCGVMSCRVT